MSRTTVALSTVHLEKLGKLADHERRSKTGQMEYMIDTWARMSLPQEMEYQHVLTVSGQLENILLELMGNNAVVFVDDLASRVSESVGSRISPAATERQLRMRGYEIARDGEGRSFIDVETSFPAVGG